MWTGEAWVILDRDGRYRDANDEALSLLGVASVEALRATSPDAFAAVPPDPVEQAAWREAYFASRAQGVLAEGAFRRLDGELVRIRTIILEQEDGTFRAVFYPVERPTTNLRSKVYRIADVLAEWRAAERRLVSLDPASREAAGVAAEIDALRAQYAHLFRRSRGKG